MNLAFHISGKWDEADPAATKLLGKAARHARMKASVECECHRRTVHLNKHIFTAWIARRWQERKSEIETQLYKLKALEEQLNREEQ